MSIALIAFTLFSCNKNEWTPEKETEFKKNATASMLEKGKGLITPEQATFTMDCAVEKLKAKNISPYDSEKPENRNSLLTIMTECAQEWMKKNNTTPTLSKEWTPETEETYKNILKNSFIQTGVKREQASFLADCCITKLKEQKIGPSDLQDPKNADLVKKIGKSCGEEMKKKK